MCELFGLSASAPVDIKLSLAELARHGGDTGIHTDGWGAAFLEGHDVRVFREPAASAFSPWVRCLQDHAVQSDTVVAHIRHATHGAITLANTQPFVRELGGRAHVFVHNGHLGQVIKENWLPAMRFKPIGETDSEAAFCLLMQRLTAINLEIDNRSGRELDVFSVFAREMRNHGPANLIFATDDSLLVHADRRTQRPGVVEPPGLWMLRRSCRSEPQSEFSGTGVTVEGAALSVVLVASVPLSNEPWQPLERGSVLQLQKGTVISHRVV